MYFIRTYSNTTLKRGVKYRYGRRNMTYPPWLRPWSSCKIAVAMSNRVGGVTIPVPVVPLHPSVVGASCMVDPETCLVHGYHADFSRQWEQCSVGVGGGGVNRGDASWRTHSPSHVAWSEGRRPLGAVLHSSNEPSELSQ